MSKSFLELMDIRDLNRLASFPRSLCNLDLYIIKEIIFDDNGYVMYSMNVSSLKIFDLRTTNIVGRTFLDYPYSRISLAHFGFYITTSMRELKLFTYKCFQR